MQCKCGGSTTDREVTRDKRVVGRYRRCTACGFVSWFWFADGWNAEMLRKSGGDERHVDNPLLSPGWVQGHMDNI